MFLLMGTKVLLCFILDNLHVVWTNCPHLLLTLVCYVDTTRLRDILNVYVLSIHLSFTVMDKLNEIIHKLQSLEVANIKPQSN